MIIQTTIANKLTSNILMFAIAVPDHFTFQEIEALHEQFKQFHADAHVNFEWSNPSGRDNFICGVPVNMQKDAINLPYEDYMKKWYSPTKFSENAQCKTSETALFYYNLN